FEVNGEKTSVFENDTLFVKKGDKIRILNVLVDGMSSSTFTVNLKGFVPDIPYNTGEDRGYLIDTANLKWRKYSVYGQGKCYPVVVTRGSQEIARAYVRIR
ncbi:MAG: hypothetical protein J7K33_09225, partial [Candidatus Marinimicrobia bacterium]|nr:hypothetical protein [Candidatus Neomarinimicrobiota bacterium]